MYSSCTYPITASVRDIRYAHACFIYTHAVSNENVFHGQYKRHTECAVCFNIYLYGWGIPVSMRPHVQTNIYIHQHRLLSIILYSMVCVPDAIFNSNHLYSFFAEEVIRSFAFTAWRRGEKSITNQLCSWSYVCMGYYGGFC